MWCRSWRSKPLSLGAVLQRTFSAGNGDGLQFLDSLVNHEKGKISSQVDQEEEKFPLERMHELLDRMGNPQNALRAVPVIGSTGKGSITCFLTSILSASQGKVGRMLSPHLMHLTERISRAVPPDQSGTLEDISYPELDRMIMKYRPMVQELISTGRMVTYFEFLAALSFVYFLENGVRHVVVESGLGGPTDATNVFPRENVDCTVISPIEMEHVGILGHTLEEIVDTEIAVIKQGRPVILAKQHHASVKDRIMKEILKKQCLYHQNGEELISVQHKGFDFSQNTPREILDIFIDPQLANHKSGLHLENVRTQMMGQHQHENIKTCLAAAFLLKSYDWPVKIESFQTGLQDAFLPGRFQVFRPHPNAPWTLLDGAHTKESAKALASSIRALFPHEALVFILCMAKDKQHASYVEALMGAQPDVVIFTSSHGLSEAKRMLPPGTLLAMWEKSEMERKFRCRKTITSSISTALFKAHNEIQGLQKSESQSPGVICVTGSFYILSETEHNLNELTF